MAKKDKSILGSIIKGTVDVAGEIIKTSYDAATSESAKKIYKKTGETLSDLKKRIKI